MPKEVVKCTVCKQIWTDAETVEWVKKEAEKGPDDFPCPNFTCNGILKVIEVGND